MSKHSKHRRANAAFGTRLLLGLIGALALAALMLKLADTASVPTLSREDNWSFEVQDQLARTTQDKTQHQDNAANDTSSLASAQVIVNADGVEYASQQVLLSFDGSITEERLVELLKDEGIEVEEVRLVSQSLEGNEVLVEVHYKGADDPMAVSEALKDTEFVTSAGPNLVETLCEDANSGAEAKGQTPADVQNLEARPNDSYYSSQWGNEAIGASAAWDTITSNQQVTVVVIDSGLDSDHPDLVDNLVPAQYVKNTYTEETGYTAIEDDSSSYHGTHVAGIIAATANNSEGIAGVSYNAYLLPIKVTYDSKGKTYISDIIEAIDYAVSLKTSADSPAYLKNIRIINLSLGGYTYDSTGAYPDAIARANDAGILVVGSAGNGSTNSSHYPSAYPHVLGVSALERGEDGLSFDSSYSNYGSYVDLSAPGTKIYSTIVGGHYKNMSGTSMAAPMVSGTAALLFAQNMGATPAEVEEILEQTANDLGDVGRDDYYGYGAVRADYAVGSKPITKAVIAAIPDQQLVDGAATPEPTVTYEATVLTKDRDYTLAYQNNDTAGTGTVVITGIWPYRGSISATFTILPEVVPQQEQVISASDLSVVAGGSATLNAKTSGDGTLSYSSSDTTVATVDSSGTVRGLTAGTAQITVSASETESYLPASTVVTVTVTEPSPTQTVNVYRMYNRVSSEHLYSTSKAEYDSCGKGAYRDWDAEGIGWVAPSEGDPVYRLYNDGLGDHHYTADVDEMEWLIKEHGWVSEGMAFCSGGEVGIYRLYNGGFKHGQHHFTASKSEVDWLAANHGWNDEGIKLFCISVPAKQES